MGGEWEVSDERRRERERGRGRGTRQIEERPRAPPPTVEEEQGKWCNGDGRPVCVLVKRVWSELNPRLGHGESIKPSPRPAEVGRGRLREPATREETFTAGNLHTHQQYCGAKIVLVVTRWKLHSLTN